MKPENVWFTADLHLGHSRIIQYCSRPFTDHEHMEQVLVENFQCIAPGERLYVLGDIAWSTYPWERFFSRLRTKEIHIIWGNHDKQRDRGHYDWVRSYADIRDIRIGTQHIVLCHYAMKSWLRKGTGAFQLYGHSHGKLAGEGRQLDVGVDCWDYKPVNYNTIHTQLSVIPYKQVEE